MAVAENIKKIRKERNLTQKELGDLLHVSNKTISKWESNRSLPDIDIIKSIAKVFDIDYKIIIDGEILDEDEAKLITQSSKSATWIRSLYIISLVVTNYFFAKAYIILDVDYIFLFIMILVSSIVLLVICKSLKYKRSIKGSVYLSISSLNIFLVTTIVFTTEELYLELIFKLAIYWLIVSIVSFYFSNNVKSKISFLILFSVYLIMKLFIPFIVLFGIGMSSYGNI